MVIESRDKILAEKVKRRETIKELEFHARGDCIHIGKISAGCRTCFARTPLSNFPVYTGCECNVKCGCCYYDKNRNDTLWDSSTRIRNNLSEFYSLTMNPNSNISEISYNSFGETLLYPNVIKEASSILKRYEKDFDKRVYSHLYTNGILADKDMLEFLKSCGVIELRFHLSASGFSKKVMDNMETASKMGFIVSVEEPALPENKEKIIEMMPFFNSIGVKHLNMVECQVTSYNRQYLEKTYPNGRIYRDMLWHLYDEGMVYDIMENKIKNNFSFSIIDCNSRVECCRDTNQITRVPEFLDLNMMDPVCNDIF